MPREFLRSDRMAEQLRRELAEIIQDEIKDPRVGFLSFTEVRMSRDLSHAAMDELISEAVASDKKPGDDDKDNESN